MEKVRPGFAFLFVAQIWRLGSPEKPCRHVQFQPFGSGWWGELQCYRCYVLWLWIHTTSFQHLPSWLNDFKMNDIYKQFENVSIWKSYRNQKGNIKPCQMMSNVQFLKSAFEKNTCTVPQVYTDPKCPTLFHLMRYFPENSNVPWKIDGWKMYWSYWNSAFLGDICSSGCKFIHG